MNNEPEQTTGNRPDWDAIKGEYLEGQTSLRQLARTKGVSFHTVANRAKRERWATTRRQLGDAVATTVATKALEKATAEGERIGIVTAQEFIDRSQSECGEWLDRIQTLAQKGELSPDSLQKLVNAWKTTVSAGREAFGLDQPLPACPAINVMVLSSVKGLPSTAEAGESA